MTFLDNLRNLVNGKGDNVEMKRDEPHSKSMLVTEVLNLVGKINKINSFDSSIRGLTNTTSYQLETKSLAELQQLKNTLDYALSNLEQKNQRSGVGSTDVEKAKWTGVPSEKMTNQDLDSAQRRDDR